MELFQIGTLSYIPIKSNATFYLSNTTLYLLRFRKREYSSCSNECRGTYIYSRGEDDIYCVTESTVDFLKVLSLKSSACHQIMTGTIIILPQGTSTEERINCLDPCYFLKIICNKAKMASCVVVHSFT